jgi:hypothetical protein
VIVIVGAGLGPFTMGGITDHVSGDPMKIHDSMALVAFVMACSASASSPAVSAHSAPASAESPGRNLHASIPLTGRSALA